MEKTYDLIIIGSGPAGLNTIWIDKNFAPGGQITATYEVDNYPGLPGMNGYELGMKFRSHADALEAKFQIAEVKDIIIEETQKTVRTNEGDFYAKNIIISTGASHRKLGVPGERELFLGRGCKKVYLIHRRDELRAAKSLQKKLMALPNVEIIWDTVVNEICGEDQVEALFIENKKTGAKKHLPVDGVFVAVGMKPNTNMVPDEIKKDEAGYIVADENCVTNVTGIFAAGDVRTKMLRQIITAAADGANAVESVQHGI